MTRPSEHPSGSPVESATPEHVTLLGEDGRPVCERCVLAARPRERLRGLLGRRTLRRGDGLLMTPAWSVHTWFMRFPIDVVFLDRGFRVLALRERLAPWDGAAHPGARHVLELAAGECRRRRLRVGEALGWGLPGLAARGR